MKKIALFFIFFYTLFTVPIKAQNINFEAYNFHPPVDFPMILAGNFGELRSNHFHTGIDIKTNQRTGYNIYSIEEGYVSRIKIRPWGYGHALYITHPNGLTSVYAHLKKFVGKIHTVALARQKSQKEFMIDYFPPKGALKIKKGQIIAKSGNTGSTAGPHLHFEIRTTKTELPLNPLLFNFDIKDTRSPLITRLKVYSLTKEGYRVPGKSKVYTVYGEDGNYQISGNTVTIPASYTSAEGGIGFAFDTFDQLNAASNPCGVDEALLIVDGDTIYKQDKTYLNFYVNRYVNAHTDYQEFHRHRRYFEKTFKTKENPLPIYKKLIHNGKIKAKPGKEYNIHYIVKDVYENSSQIQFQLKVKEGEMVFQQKLYPSQKKLYPDSAFLTYTKNYYILFPPGLLYEPTPLILNYEHPQLTFGDAATPLQSSFKLMLPIQERKYKDKYYIQRESNGRKHTEKGTVKDGWITSRIDDFGTFSAKIDTLPPILRAKNVTPHETINGERLRWRIYDEASGLTDYDIFIDGTWYLLQWEPKNLSFYFDPPDYLKGDKTVVVRAKDYCGNTTEVKYELHFQ